MKRYSNIVVGVGAMIPFALCCVAPAQIVDPIGVARLTWTIDDGVETYKEIAGQVLPNGLVRYTANVVAIDGLELLVDYTVDSTNNPMASIIGQFRATNMSPVTRTVDANFSVPLCPVIDGGTSFGGTLTILTITNANGGGIACATDSESIWEARISDRTSHKLYYCPFQMWTSGAGSMQSNQVFGAPIPGLRGPELASKAGTRNYFKITDGEMTKFTSALYVETLGTPRGCAADLNSDGHVDAMDLAVVLGNWGDTESLCDPVDLDGSGDIEAKDLAVVLGTWGPCAN